MVSCYDAEARAHQGAASCPPSSSSVTSRTGARTSVAVGEATAKFPPPRSLICHSAEMSATSETNKKLIGDAFASMVRRTSFTTSAASFLERLCTLAFYII